MTFFFLGKNNNPRHYKLGLYMTSLLGEQRGEMFSLLFGFSQLQCSHSKWRRPDFYFHMKSERLIDRSRRSGWTASPGYGRPTLNPKLELNLSLPVFGVCSYHFTNGVWDRVTWAGVQ